MAAHTNSGRFQAGTFRCLVSSALAVSIAMVPSMALPQDEGADEVIEEIITTGTRVIGRTQTETLSPVDVVNGIDLSQQGSFDLTDQLRNISPTFNTQRFPIADGTAFIRPANLRNLSPDQTLVLVNGARRHRSALVNLQAEPFGTVNQGGQAVDYGLIPSIAVKRIEVLRDGASAQYGSDAIAGVINVILKDNDEGGSLMAQYGQYTAGDGENSRIAGNIGFSLGGSGFFNASAEYVTSDITSRGQARPDAAAVASFLGDPSLVPFNGLGQRWGDPDIEALRLFFNSEYPLNDSIALYGHASYADSEVVSGFFYREPVGVPGVTPRKTLSIDNDEDGNPDPVDQAIVDDIVNQGLDPNDFVTADATSPSGFVALNPIHTMFPGGYNPVFGAQIDDYAVVVGLRGEAASELRWDISARFAENELTYSLENSINPGLGINSPTSFTPDILSQEEFGFNADLVYPVQLGGLASPLNIAFGGEYREETYTLEAGDAASWEFGPTGILFGVGSDGFQGNSPDVAGEFSRESFAAYVDVEVDVTDRFTIGVAARVESHDDFDETFDWKLAARFQVTDTFAIRGTVNTGFRAPSPGQINTLDVTTTSDASGNLVPQGTFPVNSAAAIALGATPLEPEESLNITAGIVLNLADTIDFTLDFYQIEVDDRIGLSTVPIEDGSPEQQALIDAGVPGATLLGAVTFFQNAVDSTVTGIDLAATGSYDLAGAGSVTIDFRHSWNDQDVDRVLSGTIGAERVFDLENQLPSHRTILTVDYDSGRFFQGRLRLNRYDSWEDFTFGEQASFGSQVLVDLEARFILNDQITLTAGGENVSDTKPDNETNSVLIDLGNKLGLSSPFGMNGAFWYLRAGFNF